MSLKKLFTKNKPYKGSQKKGVLLEVSPKNEAQLSDLPEVIHMKWAPRNKLHAMSLKK